MSLCPFVVLDALLPPQVARPLQQSQRTQWTYPTPCPLVASPQPPCTKPRPAPQAKPPADLKVCVQAFQGGLGSQKRRTGGCSILPSPPIVPADRGTAGSVSTPSLRDTPIPNPLPTAADPPPFFFVTSLCTHPPGKVLQPRARGVACSLRPNRTMTAPHPRPHRHGGIPPVLALGGVWHRDRGT